MPAGASKASHLRPFARPQPEATLEQAAPIAQLVERGVAGPVPRRLVEEYGQAAVVAACAEWDRRRAEGRRVGPGLLVTLVREGVGAGPGEALLSYAEMLAVCDREGITTEAFEAVSQPDGRKPLWRRKVKPVRHEPAGVQG